MPKITLDIPKETVDVLKTKAKDNCRSMTQEIIYTLRQYASGQLKYIEEGSVVTTKTTTTATVQKPLTPEEIEEQKRQTFLKKCKQMLGEKTYKNWEPDIVREFIVLVPGSSYYEEAERIPDKGIRMAYTMPDSKQDEYITEIKKYIDHEEGR